jgi:predicted metal-dependent hydrolase
VAEFVLGSLRVSVLQKEVKHVQLSVLPPDGQVRVTAPSHLSLESIRLYTLSSQIASFWSEKVTLFGASGTCCDW